MAPETDALLTSSIPVSVKSFCNIRRPPSLGHGTKGRDRNPPPEQRRAVPCCWAGPDRPSDPRWPTQLRVLCRLRHWAWSRKKGHLCHRRLHAPPRLRSERVGKSADCMRETRGICRMSHQVAYVRGAGQMEEKECCRCGWW
ncbi:hypothetical protein NDU88_010196 [Pleurodeles waltl]|uniref:Uncharacterized protein n=1 Tax=Pleurodeles waltl TaxID=8319 RepID=A0AAV7RZW4_PLEWA|nr:hypothetical protein NDU88_010196 [Pleurodeles waltl]